MQVLSKETLEDKSRFHIHSRYGATIDMMAAMTVPLLAAMLSAANAGPTCAVAPGVRFERDDTGGHIRGVLCHV